MDIPARKKTPHTRFFYVYAHVNSFIQGFI